MKRLIERLQNFLGGILGKLAGGLAGSLALVTLVAAMLIFLGIVAFLASRPRWVELARDLDEMERSAVERALSEMDEEYRRDDGSVLVPSHRLPELRARLARQEILPGTRLLGYEDILHEDAFYETSERRELVERVALQGELARMLRGLRGVDEARVLIQSAGNGASVSVGLRMRPGFSLDGRFARSVASLACGAVSELSPEKLAIVDLDRPERVVRPLAPADDLAAGLGSFDLRRRIEAELAGKVRAFFAGMGIDSAVLVSAELDLDRVKERLRKVDPTGQIVRESRSPESRETEFEYGWLVQEITREPKGVIKVKASVVLFDRLVEDEDGELKYDRSVVQGKLGEFKKLVANALGADLKADEDAVQVSYLPSAVRPPSPPPIMTRELAKSAISWLVVVSAAGAAVFVLFLAIRPRRPAPPPEPPEEELPEELPPEVRELRQARELAGRTLTRRKSEATVVARRWLSTR